MNTKRTCALDGCGRLRWNNRSRYCSTHTNSFNRYGAPTAKAVPVYRLEECEPALDRGLTKYANTTAVANALKLAAEVLTFRPPSGFTTHITMANQMARLRSHGVTPREFLLRVAAHYEYARVRPFRDDRAFNAALSRAVLRLAPLDGYRPLCRVLQWLADEITDRLAMFSTAFIARLESDAEREREVRRASADFDSSAEATSGAN